MNSAAGHSGSAGCSGSVRSSIASVCRIVSSGVSMGRLRVREPVGLMPLDVADPQRRPRQLRRIVVDLHPSIWFGWTVGVSPCQPCTAAKSITSRSRSSSDRSAMYRKLPLPHARSSTRTDASRCWNASSCSRAVVLSAVCQRVQGTRSRPLCRRHHSIGILFRVSSFSIAARVSSHSRSSGVITTGSTTSPMSSAPV